MTQAAVKRTTKATVQSIRSTRTSTKEEEVTKPRGSSRADKATFPGAALISTLLKTADERGISYKDLAEQHLKITYVYLNYLSIGERSVPDVDDKILRRAAVFLERPLAEVDNLAERRSLQDYFVEMDLDERLNQIWRQMRADAVWGTYAPTFAEWSALPKKAQLFIGTMYENQARTNLLPRPRLRAFLHEAAEKASPKGGRKPAGKKPRS